MTILNDLSTTSVSSGTILILLLFVIVSLISLVLSFKSFMNKEEGKFIILIPFLILSPVIAQIILDTIEDLNTERYEVLIEDYNEVIGEGFRIEDKRGSIYIIER